MLSTMQRTLNRSGKAVASCSVLLLLGLCVYIRIVNDKKDASLPLLKLLTKWNLGLLLVGATTQQIMVAQKRFLLRKQSEQLVDASFEKALHLEARHSERIRGLLPATISHTVDRENLPPSSDFWILGKNLLMVSNGHFHFGKEIKSIMQMYLSSKEAERAVQGALMCRYGQQDPWARDFISTKTQHRLYVFNKDVKHQSNGCNGYADYHNNIFLHNSHLTPFVNYNVCAPRQLCSNLVSKATQVAVLGGNVFHCVNTFGYPYLIVGEYGITSQTKLEQPSTTSYEFIGNKSASKYRVGDCKQNAEFIEQRQRNKRLLKLQSGDYKVAIVPNAFFYHLDLEMCALPNGVVLLHSNEESLKFIDIHKSAIQKTMKSLFLTSEYQDLRAHVLKHLAHTERLFTITATKLRKRGFIVVPVCGFLTVSDNYKGMIATGFNGLPTVLKDGKVLYTLPKNPDWYDDYFRRVLEKAGVSVVTTITSENLSYLARQGGFFRCQTQTIPMDVLKLESRSPK